MNLDTELREPEWERVVQTLTPGTDIPAQRFFAMLGRTEEGEMAEAAMALWERGVGLDVSGLPRLTGGCSARRLELEEELVRQGRMPEGLEKGDGLRLYWQEIERIPPIRQCRPEDILRLTREPGTLLEGLLWLVRQEAPGFVGRGVLLLDLMQEGAMALLQAVENPGENLVEEARRCVRQAMARAVVLQYAVSGEAERLLAAMRAYQQADRRLLRKLGRNPGVEELALELAMTPDEVRRLGEMVQQAARTPADQKSPEREEEPESVEDSACFQLRSRVEELLSTLEEGDRQLLTLRFGLGGKPPMSQEETAAALGITLEQAMAREQAAMVFLRTQ